ncbi:DUF4857 domain-containing protein [Proteiniphilum sp.]|uniref:DUF4857 domain-containing protein n=1 Tax=Proteiniphilum sp. TaxID=1926877 RepID=UPI002B1EBF5D|nr:DUF4857 domain-containing protein [Proteiniphilum sp.]MEA4916138.1 DUF4857 domain-containing protein [Proteiniphilum sp.]
MMNKSFYRIIIILIVTLVAMWAMPAIVKKATSAPQKYPFVYYSSIIEEFCYREVEGKKTTLRDASGRQYTEAQFDSILPMMYYRQLSTDGRMPDSIRGQAVTMPLIRQKSFTFRYNSNETSAPNFGLYVMYESLPKRLNLETPDDVFRMKEKIEFIDVTTNKVNHEKSDLFTQELEKRGYSFPAQWSQGILTIRKPYDEGYFTLDAEGKLFHMKMVNGRPFIRDTHAGDSIDIAYFTMQAVPDKRFYGFLFDTEGSMYILEAPGYHLLKLDIPPVDVRNDDVMIMANMFFWTVNVIKPGGRYTYALQNDNLTRVDEAFIAANRDNWDKASQWLFPAYITLKESNTKYIGPQIHFATWNAFILNAILALLCFFLIKRKKEKLPGSLWILLTGIAGLIALSIVSQKE